VIVKFAAAATSIGGDGIFAEAQYLTTLLEGKLLNVRYKPVTVPFPPYKSMSGEDGPGHALCDLNVVFNLALIMRQEG
jgi:hypothetical protein